jgi:GST-like protein
MKLYGRPGWGSAIIEAQLDWYGVDYDYQDVGNLFKSADARESLASVNPISQVPALELDDGTIMTESAAMTLLLAESTGSDALVPAPGDTDRPAFLRWLVFIVASIYPTYTYGDDVARFVDVESAQAGYREKVDAWAQRMYSVLEKDAGAPWYLGERFSALDIYIAVLSGWRPGIAWFQENTPSLARVVAMTHALPRLAPCWARNKLAD